MKDLITKLAIGSDVSGNSGLDNNNTLVSDIKGILNAILGVLALACAVVIIIGGVSYMTSSGDAGKVKKAKDTILYGIIGLVVCALAFAIVTFITGTILGGAN